MSSAPKLQCQTETSHLKAIVMVGSRGMTHLSASNSLTETDLSTKGSKGYIVIVQAIVPTLINIIANSASIPPIAPSPKPPQTQSKMQTSSTTSLLPSSSSSYRFSSKKWEASFGKLASSYGFGATIPSLPPKTKSDKTTASKSNSNPSEHSFAPTSEKDYESAFGSLSSTYGFNGGVPSKPARCTKATKPSPSPSPSSLSNSQPKITRPPKDYSSAFGDLSSSYGFGGACSPSFTKK